jgi:hypothetical protein
MKPTRRLRSAVGTTLAATALSFVASAAFAAPIAMANPLCEGADVSGDWIGAHDPVLVCVPTPLTVACASPQAGLEPSLEVSALICVPV